MIKCVGKTLRYPVGQYTVYDTSNRVVKRNVSFQSEKLRDNKYLQIFIMHGISRLIPKNTQDNDIAINNPSLEINEALKRMLLKVVYHLPRTVNLVDSLYNI